ncbi:amylo-alpha-1,6-glucosidase [Streptomyces niger]|uniref:amylo-alpha-1,6-glucosidase n=1 Tax=Streptomyces niger TaxID=66373 RepID=UPI000699F584|nr:glycogen debranching N-terminal domain-containing protein [Streptomyces niger]
MTSTDQRVLVHDGTFAVLGPAGDVTGVRGTAPDGLFLRDARHLSRWQLTVDGAAPALLVPTTAGGATQPLTSVLTPHGTRDEPPAYTVFREQAVFSGTLIERIRLTSNRGEATTATLEITADADFADQFELRADHRSYAKPHTVRTRETRADGVEFGYRRGPWHSRTTVTAQPRPDTVGKEPHDGRARVLHWRLELPPHGAAELRLRVTAHPHGAPQPDADRTGDADPAAVAHRLAAEVADFAGTAPLAPLTMGPHGAHRSELDRACEQGLVDLAGLRVTVPGPDGEALRVPGAGVPWFLTLFGRDSLLTSFFALPYRPELAEATLLALTAAQATAADPARLAQPGKIVHEIRHGELAFFDQVPYGRYYGSVDATPLYLVLLDAYAEAAGAAGTELARRLEGPARAAVEWMFRHGGLDTDGYLAYRAHEGGLANQNWKDSPGAVCATDGTRPAGAVLVAEVQGYAYDALRRTARLARDLWGDEPYAARLGTAAEALRRRFAADFWMADRSFPVLALDATGRRADVLASDAGHLLWSGILDQEAGETVGRRLLEPDFFSGWGVRTLAAGQPPYHPLSYHRGSIWPHDNAVIALGLARYGLHKEVHTIADGLIEAAALHGHRLPEVLAGYDRDRHPAPVPYPHSCSPQAWAAATPLALRTAVRNAGPEAAPDG